MRIEPGSPRIGGGYEDGSYWPPGLPQGRAGAIEMLRCDAHWQDYLDHERCLPGDHTLLEHGPSFAGERFRRLAELLESDGIQAPPSGPRSRLPVQRSPDHDSAADNPEVIVRKAPRINVT